MLHIQQGNIFDAKTDAIVIPATPDLRKVSGISEKAYHKLGEKQMVEICNNLRQQAQKTKQIIHYGSVVSSEINHPIFKYIFFAIVPIYNQQQKQYGLDQLLRMYENIFNQLKKYPIKSIAIPALGSGLAGFEFTDTLIKFKTTFDSQRRNFSQINFIFVLFDQNSHSIAHILLEESVKKNNEVSNQTQTNSRISQTQLISSTQNQNGGQNQYRFNSQQQQYQQISQEEEKNNVDPFNNHQQSQSNQYIPLKGYKSIQQPQQQQYQGNKQEQIQQEQKQQQQQYSQQQKYQQELGNQYQQNNQQNKLKNSQEQQQNKQQEPKTSKQQFGTFNQNTKQNTNDGFEAIKRPSQEDSIIKKFGDALDDNKSQKQINSQSQQSQQQLIKIIQKQEQDFVYIFLEIQYIGREQINNQISLMTTLLQLCKQIFDLHYNIAYNQKKFSLNTNNFNLTYQVSKSQNSIMRLAPPEMIENKYISEKSDMFTFGVILYYFLFQKYPFSDNLYIYREEIEQFQKSSLQQSKPQFAVEQKILEILEKQLSDTTAERMYPHHVVQQLLTLTNNYEIQNQWELQLQKMKQFYDQIANTNKIQEELKQYLIKSNQQEKQLKQNQQNQQQDQQSIDFNGISQISQNDCESKIIFEKQNPNAQISDSQNNQPQQDSENQTLLDLKLNINLNSQMSNKPDQSLYTQLQNINIPINQQVNVQSVLIPVNKINFENSLPSYCNFNNNLINSIQQQTQYSLQTEGFVLHSLQETIKDFNNKYIILIFGPCYSQTQGRSLRLFECFLEILLFSSLTQKVNSICLCQQDLLNCQLDDRDRQNYSIQQLMECFQRACVAFTQLTNREIILDEYSLYGKTWTKIKFQSQLVMLKNFLVSVEQQNIAEMCKVDVVVNAANKQLMNGAGVCGAIFNQCGAQDLEQEIKQFLNQQNKTSIQEGEVMVTKPYNMKNQGVKHIFHAVGPMYQEQNHNLCVSQLQQCIANILIKCQELKITSIAIPLISSGIYGFPKQLCADIFYDSLCKYKFDSKLRIYFVTLENDTKRILKIKFSNQKMRDILFANLDEITNTECLLVPLDPNNLNHGVVKRILEQGGENLKSELHLALQKRNHQQQSEFTQILIFQGYQLKKKGISNIMFLINQNTNQQDNIAYVLYQTFYQILVECFQRKEYESISLLFYGILQNILNNQDQQTYNGQKAVKILLDVINDFKNNFKDKIGRITLISNQDKFLQECGQLFTIKQI